MTRASWITLLAIVVLASFAGVAPQTAARFGGLSLEDRIPQDSAKAARPFTLDLIKMSVGRLLWGLDCCLWFAKTPIFSKHG